MISSYEDAVGANAAWIYFSHHWHNGPDGTFPSERAQAIRTRGSVPFIRLMLRDRAEWEGTITSPTRYSLQAIVESQFDSVLMEWMKGAAAYRAPLMVEFGTEVNDSSFPWNGTWNGADAGAPLLFRMAFRHIVHIAERAHADNIQWVFHVSYGDTPDKTWNHLEEYYPGDDVVDWIAVSVYGTHQAGEPMPSFEDTMDDVYPRLASLRDSAAKVRGDTTPKPMIVAEFGTARDHRQAIWAGKAIQAMLCRQSWAALRGFAWWNSNFPNHDGTDSVYMRVESNPQLAGAFRALLKDNPCILEQLTPDPAGGTPRTSGCRPHRLRRPRSRHRHRSRDMAECESG
jgi:hypothetical protein